LHVIFTNFLDLKAYACAADREATRIRGETDALLMHKTRTFFSFRTRLVHIEYKYVDFHILRGNVIYVISK